MAEVGAEEGEEEVEEVLPPLARPDPLVTHVAGMEESKEVLENIIKVAQSLLLHQQENYLTAYPRAQMAEMDRALALWERWMCGKR